MEILDGHVHGPACGHEMVSEDVENLAVRAGHWEDGIVYSGAMLWRVSGQGEGWMG